MKKLSKVITIGIMVLLSTQVVLGEGSNSSDGQSSQKIDKSSSSFQNDLFSGIASYSYDLSFPEGQRGMTPRLNLSYNSAVSDFLDNAGYGFSVQVPGIFRSTRKGTNNLYKVDEYAINADFGNNELVKTGSGVFGGKNNNDLNKYDLSNDSWVVKDTKGNTYTFGDSTEYKQINPNNNLTFRWLLKEKVDNFGYKIKYFYEKRDNNVYLSEMQYAFKDGIPLYKIKLNYIDKTFSTNSYIYGFKLENHRLLGSVAGYILDNGNYTELKRYDLIYQDKETTFPKLTEIKEVVGNYSKPSTKFQYYTFGIGMNLLSQIDNGRGSITKLEYKASTAYKNTTVPFVLKTLYKVTNTESTTGLFFSKTYDYYGGNFYFDPTNVYGRGYTGFGKVRILDDDGSYKDVYFHQSDSDKNNAQNSLLGEFEDHISKKGRTYREEEYDNDGKIYTTKIYKWNKTDKGNGIFFVNLDRVTNILWNKDSNHLDTAETYEYNNYGNVIKNTKYGEVTANTGNGDFADIKDDKRIQEFKYTTDSNLIMVNEVCEEKLSDNNNNILILNKNYYDNLSSCQIDKGLITRKSAYYKEEDRYLNLDYSYTTSGLLQTEKDYLGNINIYEYDSYNLLPIKKTNPKGWQETYEYDYKIQKPVSVININGVRTNFQYDVFGRNTQKSVINPEDQSEKILEKTTINEVSLPNFIEIFKFSDNNDFIKSRIYFDGLYRDIETKTTTKYSDKFSTVKTKYDKDGNKEFITYERFETDLNYSPISSEEKGNTFNYDTLGRILKQINKTGETRFEYNLLKTTQTNQKGVKKSVYNDVFGNLSQVQEFNNGETYTTNYEYNLLNKLARIIDAKGNIRNSTYDSLGRVTKMEDLHALSSINFGYVTYKYNDNSQIIEKKALSGEKLTYEYDNLGRVTKETVVDKDNIFEYDNGTYAKGLLTKTSKIGYSEEYKYNYLNQKTEDKKNYTTTNYTTKYDYDIAGNVIKVTYPDNTFADYVYLSGFLNKVKYNNTEILSNLDFAPNNNPNKFVYANGVTTEDNLDYTYGYRIIGRKSYLGVATYQDLSYNFDTVGNITGINNTASNELKKQSNYTYDDLGRLLTVNYIDYNNQNSAYAYNYDSIGNIIYNSQIGNYAYSNGTNPHAVTTIGTGTSLSYDTNGNVNQETNSGISKNYTYNPKQELLSFSSNNTQTAYLYNNSSTRVFKRTTSSGTIDETKYIDGTYEQQIHNTTGTGGQILTTSITTHKYILVGGTKIATIQKIDSNPEKTIYHLIDHLGGASIDVSSTGAILQLSDYLPYGSDRVLVRNDNYKNNYLFTGKEKDEESSLQYFEARYYNPENGRFYSQDRVFWELGITERGINILVDPQSLNSYAYARNNPLIYTDPSGEEIDDYWNGFKKGVNKGVGVLSDAMVGIGDGIEKGARKLTPTFIAGGCVVGGTTLIVTTEGTMTVFSPYACAGGAAVGGTAGVGLEQAGKIIKIIGQTGKEFSKDNENGGGGNNTSSEKKPEYKTPKQGTGKEKASDVPSWAKGNRPYKGESGNDFAKRLMDNRYGKGKWNPKETGASSDYSKIKKWGDRGFQ